MTIRIVPRKELRPPGTRLEALAADRSKTCPAQVFIYLGPGDPIPYEGVAVIGASGDIELILPIAAPPPASTPIQILIEQGPGDPLVIEGRTTAPAPDGSFGVSVSTMPVDSTTTAD